MTILFNLLSVLYFTVFLAAGQLAACVLFSGEPFFQRSWLGGVVSLVLLLWLPALFSFALGFTLAAQLLALVCAAALGGYFVFHMKKSAPLLDWKLQDKAALLCTLLPFFLLGLYLFITHTIFPEYNGSLHAGQSTFGDLPLHLGLVTSIGEQGFFPPEYSILPGTAVGYPFLCDSISATFYVLGASLRFSMLLPAVFAYALVLCGVYAFFSCWLKSKRTTVFATCLFFLGGGFGFVYFLDLWKLLPDNFFRIFEAFYQTPTNNVEVGLKWVNPIADMLIPQRATLFGWALLFPALFMLRRAAFESQPKWFVPLAVLAGCMPLVHTHSFLALGVLSAFYFAHYVFFVSKSKDMLSGWLCYGAIALLLAAPQLLLFTFRQSSGFLTFHFNWANETDSFLWFYIKNLGLLFLLLPAAFLQLPREERRFYGGALLLWALSEFIQFQPNPYDNNKLLFVWFAFTCGIVASFLMKLYDALKHTPGIHYLTALTMCALFLSGILTLGRECVSDYEQFSSHEVEAAEYILQSTEPDAVFLTASNHNNAVAALSGRNIVCGTGSYLFFHGLDYAERESSLRLLYEDPALYLHHYAEEYGISYVWVGAAERYSYACNIDYFESRFPTVYQNAMVRIYDVRNLE